MGDTQLVGCTNFLQVAITAPTSGTVAVQGMLSLRINHVNGQESTWGIFVDRGAITCDWNRAYVEEVGASEPSNPIMQMTGVVIGSFSVPAGSHTFYLRAYMWFGEGGDVIDQGSLIAVFYPS